MKYDRGTYPDTHIPGQPVGEVQKQSPGPLCGDASMAGASEANVRKVKETSA